MSNWKTSLFGFLAAALQIAGVWAPNLSPRLTQTATVLSLGAGLVAAQDGKKDQ